MKKWISEFVVVYFDFAFGTGGILGCGVMITSNGSNGGGTSLLDMLKFFTRVSWNKLEEMRHIDPPRFMLP